MWLKTKNFIQLLIRINSRPLTKEEEKAISDFIRADKEKRKRKELKAKTVAK